MASSDTFVNQHRQDVRDLLNKIEILFGNELEYNAQAGSLFIDKGSWYDELGEPTRDITPEEFISSFTSIAALRDFLQSGHATNLYKVAS